MKIAGRIIVIGDIHGCIRELEELIEQIKIVPSDSLYFIGDLIDRGPDSSAVVKRCFELTSQCHVQLILGNHEEKFLRWLHHVENKTGTESSMSGTHEFPELMTSLNESEIAWLKGAYYSLYIKEEGITLLHGGISNKPDFPFPETYRYGEHSPKKLKGLELITKLRYLTPNGKFVSINEETEADRYWAEVYDGSFGHIFFGHQPFLQELPKEFPHATGLDTGCVFGGWLSAVVIENGSRRYISVKAKETYAQIKNENTNININQNNNSLKENQPSVVLTNKEETGNISQAKSIIFLPFDLNVSNPEIKEPYTRIRSGPGKRNKLLDIINDPDKKLDEFKTAITKDNFKLAESIIDSSKYLDFIVNNFNYKKTIDEKVKIEDTDISFLDWYEKTGEIKKYILPENESEQKKIDVTKTEFEIDKFGILLNKSARSGSVMIEITWSGDADKLELLSEIDFLRYHDDEKGGKIKEVVKKEFSYILSEQNEINSLIKFHKPKLNNIGIVELAGEVKFNDSKINDYGFCLSKNTHPTISDKLETIKINKKNIKVKLENIDKNTTYYFRAYAVNEKGEINYGSVNSFICSTIFEVKNDTTISEIIKTNYTEIYNLIFFNHVKPIVVHLISDSQAFKKEDEKLSELIYKTLRIPAKSISNIPQKINYSEIVNLQSPDENISFATMNEGVLIIDNTIKINELKNKYLPAFVLALNQREFLLKVIRLVPSVDIKELVELKALKKFITEVYLKQISFAVSVYNEIDILFSELQNKFDIEILMKDNKESINEIHQLIEDLDIKEKEEEEKKKKEEDGKKEKYFNKIILGLTIIQAGSIFYTLIFNLFDKNNYLNPTTNTYLFSFFLFINILIIINIALNYYKNKK
jgi:serine/threonine protein phosphatase 1